jgi:hypothetical protein
MEQSLSSVSNFFLIRILGGGGGVQLGPLGTSAIYWPLIPAPSDYDDGENLVE